MDPFSAAANALALLGLAAQSAQILVEYLRAFVKASEAVRQHTTALETLSSTLTGIQTLGRVLPPEYAWPGEFHSRLESCLADLDAIKKKLKGLGDHLRRDGMKRAYARMKWYSLQREMQPSFARIQLYIAAFSTDLSILQV